MEESRSYAPPQVEVVEAEVEQGFAGSYGGENGKEEWM